MVLPDCKVSKKITPPDQNLKHRRVALFHQARIQYLGWKEFRYVHGQWVGRSSKGRGMIWHMLLELTDMEHRVDLNPHCQVQFIRCRSNLCQNHERSKILKRQFW